MENESQQPWYLYKQNGTADRVVPRWDPRADEHANTYLGPLGTQARPKSQMQSAPGTDVGWIGNAFWRNVTKFP